MCFDPTHAKMGEQKVCVSFSCHKVIPRAHGHYDIVLVLPRVHNSQTQTDYLYLYIRDAPTALIRKFLF